MNTKHTPGEWDIFPISQNTVIIKSDEFRADKKGTYISEIKWDRASGGLSEEDYNNAQLIAYSPELLEMVYLLMKCVKRLTDDNLTQEQRDAEAEWIGEAHELLYSINPDYYKNANEQ